MKPFEKADQYELYIASRRKIKTYAAIFGVTRKELIDDALQETNEFAEDWSLDVGKVQKQHPEIFFDWEKYETGWSDRRPD